MLLVSTYNGPVSALTLPMAENCANTKHGFPGRDVAGIETFVVPAGTFVMVITMTMLGELVGRARML